MESACELAASDVMASMTSTPADAGKQMFVSGAKFEALAKRISTERHSHPVISFPDDAACELQTVILDDQVEVFCKG
jgi:hypothetical protein